MLVLRLLLPNYPYTKQLSLILNMRNLLSWLYWIRIQLKIILMSKRILKVVTGSYIPVLTI